MRRPFLLLLAVLALVAGAPAGARCNDPWIDRAVAEVAERAPRGSGDGGECDLRLYGARWGSYEALRSQVASAFAALDAAALEFTPDGAALRDRRTGEPVPPRSLYLGPATDAPAAGRRVPLPRGYLLVVAAPHSDGR